MKYTQDYFSRNIPLFTEHLKELKGKPDVLFLEVGTYEGRSAIWLLENILTHESARLHIIDPFDDSPIEDINTDYSMIRKNFTENIEPYKEKIMLMQDVSENAWPKLLENKYDAVYIDGSHMACSVLLDAVMSWVALKKGGIIIFDDYQWGAGKPPHLRPKLAIDAFLEAYTGQYELLNKSYQVIIKKL